MRNFVWKVEIFISILVFGLVTVNLILFWPRFPYPTWIELGMFGVVILVYFVLGFKFEFLARIAPIWFWSSILVIFCVSRIWWLVNVPTLPVSDFIYYLEVARDVAAGNGLTKGVVLYQNGWGYQIFLGAIFAMFGSSLSIVKLFNLFLGLSTIPLIYLAGRELRGETLGRWAAILFVFWPGQWMYTSVAGTEHLALPIAMAGLWLGLRLFQQKEETRWFSAILPGIFFTLGVIVRPAILMYLVAFILIFLVLDNNPKRKSFAVVLLVTYLGINGVYNLSLRVFNFGVVPSFSFSTAANLYYGSNLESNGGWTEEDMLVVSSWSKENALQNALPLTWQRLRSYSFRQLLQLYNAKDFEFWGSSYYGLHFSTLQLDEQQPHISLPINKLNGAQYLFQFLILFGSMAGLLGLSRNSYEPKISALILILIFGTFLHLIFAISSRYNYVFTPLLFMLSVYGLSEIGRRTSRSDYPEQLKGDISAKSRREFNQVRIKNWDWVAKQDERWTSWNRFYHQRLRAIYRFLIPKGARVLELGCAKGDLLAVLQPSYGVGVDFSSEMIARARDRHPELKFIEDDAHEMDLDEKFDFIILSDLINDLWDVEDVLKAIQKNAHPRTRLILNYYSRIWSPLLSLTEGLNLSRPKLLQNWLVNEDVSNLLYLTGFEVLRSQNEILWPLPFRLFDVLFNRFLVKLWPFRFLGLTNFMIARPAPQGLSSEERPVVSVIVPARNEAGNIPDILTRIPEMGGGTEIIFVEGHSTDGTYEAIQEAIQNTERPCRCFKQTGVGKADAVRLGFEKARGDILMILDADLTVAPESLPSFYETLMSGKGELVNGVRMVYPMGKNAMQFLNLIGNKFFSLAFGWLIGQPVKDTLCGTKALWKKDYEQIVANRSYFGDFDPFGDFDLIFGAAKLNLKITDLPIRYQERVYGSTNIQRWKHGLILLRMVFFSARRIKFV